MDSKEWSASVDDMITNVEGHLKSTMVFRHYSGISCEDEIIYVSLHWKKQTVQNTFSLLMNYSFKKYLLKRKEIRTHYPAYRKIIFLQKTYLIQYSVAIGTLKSSKIIHAA